MFTHPIGLISLSGLVIGATAPVALAQQNPFLNAQNPVTALQNGITFQSGTEHKQHALAPTPRKSGFSSASDCAPSQHNGYKSAYRTTVYGAGFVVGERRGHVARLVAAARKS
jgi:hypothetical protein